MFSLIHQAGHRRLCRRVSGSTVVFVLVALVIVAALVGLAWYTMRGDQAEVTEAPLLARVTNGPYDHVVLEQGEIESSNNVEIRCEVRARATSSGPATSIIDVIPEGTHVKPGDWLITFDSSALEQELSRQRIAVNTAEAVMIQAKATHDTALIAREEYLQGAYNEQKKLIENQIFVAEETLKKAQLSFDSIKRLVSRGLLSDLQLEGEQFRVDAAQNDLDLNKQKLNVLVEITKKKMLTQLESDIQASQVKYRNEQNSFQEEQNKLKEIEDQITKCRMVSPAAGQVVYANVQSSRSGSEFVVEPGGAVRERQVLIRLPDPTAMQVKATINESRITLVREGMPVSVRIDAFGDETLHGEVVKVNKYAEPGNFWSSTAKEYATIIKIVDPPPQLRVGLTAEIRIHIEHRDEALQIPVQAVYERNGKTFCLVKNGERWDTREIAISSTNDKVAAIATDGSDALQPGEEVVMNPRKHVDKFDATRFPKPVDTGEAEIAKKAPTEAPVGGGPPGQLAGTPGGAEGPAAAGSGAGGPGEPGRGGPGGPRRSPQQMIESMDANKDGKLATDELPEFLRERMANADTNNDGGIDVAELTAAFANMRPPGAGGPGGGFGPPGGDSAEGAGAGGAAPGGAQ